MQHPEGQKDAVMKEWGRSWRIIIAALAVLWAVELVDLFAFDGALDAYGVRPREVDGLLGIIAQPFLHGGIDHLLSNSFGLVALGWLVVARGVRRWLLVTSAAVVLGGLGVWTIGQAGSVHIGASGVVFAYLGYLLSAGVFDRNIGSTLLSALVGVLYGGMIFGVVPGQAGISWEAHLFGFLAGTLMAWVLAERR